MSQRIAREAPDLERICFGSELVRPVDATPKWNKLLRTGTFFRRDVSGGKVELTRADLETMVANWKAMGGQALRFDYHHWGSSSVDGVRLEDKRASGWIEQIEVRGEELWGLTKWTKEARTKILNDEYRYVSPEFAMNMTNRLTGKPQGPTLVGAALLNDPFLTDLPRVAASDVVPLAPPLEVREHESMKTLMSKLIHTLNAAGIKCSGETLEPELVVAFDQYVAQVLKLSAEHGEVVKLAASAASVEPLKVQMSALQENVKVLTAAKDALEATAKKQAIDGLIAVLMNDGKGGARITAAQQDTVRKFADKAGVEEARTFFMAGPVVLKLGEVGFAGSDAAIDAGTAYVKLQAAAAELVKAGTLPQDSLIRAMELNPELTKAAAALTSPRS